MGSSKKKGSGISAALALKNACYFAARRRRRRPAKESRPVPSSSKEPGSGTAVEFSALRVSCPEIARGADIRCSDEIHVRMFRETAASRQRERIVKSAIVKQHTRVAWIGQV